METNSIIQKLKNSIKQIKDINTTLLSISEERSLELEEKELVLLTKIVGCFDEILSDKFHMKSKNIKAKEKKSTYWTFISKHFNSPLVHFCIINDKTDFNSIGQDGNFLQKGENWIFLGILENTFSDAILEIYKQKWDEEFYEKNSLLRKNKLEIKKILNEMKQIQFTNIKSKDFDKYKEHLAKNNSFYDKGFNDLYPKKEKSIFSDISEIPILSNIIGVPYEPDNPIDSNIPLDLSENEQDEKEFFFKKNADFAPSIINNFYNFNPNMKKKLSIKENNNCMNKDNYYENEDLSFGNYNSFIDSDEEFNSSKFNEWEPKLSSGLILNPKITKFLPTDNLYEIGDKSFSREFTKNDIITYNKKKRAVSNCLLLYLNNYYKKAPYHKFYKHNLHNRPISIKDQNYQCYICFKKFSLLFGIPAEPIYWCSYYMRFVCKDCIDEEFSIIPYFVLDKWCFEKFSISKKAKNILIKWYNKPIIYFKKTDVLLKKIPQLNKVIEIKKVINQIFDIMKCEDRFNFIKENLGKYDYIALKEYLFSMKDLVEIKNKTFYKRMNNFKNIFIRHISGECPKCIYEGEKCDRCGFDERIFFYDIDNVFYCKQCKKSYHKKCIGLVEHVHL